MKSDAALVSIIMPAFNVEKMIMHSIQSVLDQTYLHWELIIIDDCSTDRTVDIIESFRDERIKLVRHKKNMGIAAGRNRGITEAKGEWIAWLDADDAWHKERLSKTVEMATKSPGSFVVSNIMLCFSDNNYKLVPWKQRPNTVSLPMARRAMLVEHNISFLDEFYGHEWLYFSLKLYSIGLSLVVIHEPLYFYRIRPDSDSTTYACIISQLKTLDHLLSADWVSPCVKEKMIRDIIPTRHRLFTTAIRERRWNKVVYHAMSSPMSILYAFKRMPHVLIRWMRQKGIIKA